MLRTDVRWSARIGEGSQKCSDSLGQLPELEASPNPAKENNELVSRKSLRTIRAERSHLSLLSVSTCRIGILRKIKEGEFELERRGREERLTTRSRLEPHSLSSR